MLNVYVEIIIVYLYYLGAFGSFWGGSTSPSEPKPAPVDPQYNLAIAHSHKVSLLEANT